MSRNTNQSQKCFIRYQDLLTPRSNDCPHWINVAVFELSTQGTVRQSLRNQGLGDSSPLPLTLSLPFSSVPQQQNSILSVISVIRGEMIGVVLELGVLCAYHHRDSLLSIRVVHVQKKLLMHYILRATGLHASRISNCPFGLRSTLLSVLQKRRLKTHGKIVTNVFNGEKPSDG